ncbi:sugar ABC transporter permease [Marispirochaeta aestuarii]|uniref:carbohydrate ABC transporter permease n=1 Tax=Marispirochaeta aestuarii TaxID=1963862 RepID=UPI0029C8AFC5|nr:sugar ABC transporter permease [Marispirochaeta aestuarii]
MVGSKKNTLYAVLVLLPSIVLLVVFVYGFIANSFYISLTDWGSGAGLRENPVKNFVGLNNYRELFTGFIHERFRQDLVNAIFYSVFLLMGTLALGLFLAILLDKSPRGENIFRTTFLFPMALSFIVTGTIWRWVFSPKGGVNVIPSWFGLEKGSFLWLSSRELVWTFNWQNVLQIIALILFLVFILVFYTAWKNSKPRRLLLSGSAAALMLLYALIIHPLLPPILPYEEIHGFSLATIGVIIAAIWQYSGYTMALYLAGLRGLPVGMYESAKMDGASDLTYYFRIAIPNMWPVTLSAIIILSHISLKLFALIFSMAGADNASTGHPSVLMYLVTFRANNFAVGAAISVILFLMAALFIIPYLIQSYRTRR